ncbi:MAG TPA: ABC transporter permease [Candidatus Methylacidiphilales bacterium]|jgi:lipopolysaccharide transport system permease protein|nr:ABC transporter permease [Candidatus Methylacidiphilales bacterium]
MHDPSVTVVSPEKTSLLQIARDLVRYRELLFLLVWREVSVRYKQTAVGIFWVILQPMLSALILGVFVFGRLGNMSSDGLPYLVFAYSGILIWGLFAQGIDRASGSIVADEQLIRKVYFPRWIIPMASVGSSLVDFAVCTLLLVVFLFSYSVPPTWHLVFFLPATLLVFFLATALGMATAALNAKYRDFRLLTIYGLQIFQFISPVYYSFQTILPKNLLWLVYLNPMAGPIELFRLSVTGTSHFLIAGFATSLAVDLLLIALCVRIFYTLEDDIVDTI